MKLTPEEWSRWRESPVTMWFMESLRVGADTLRERWINESWEGGHADPMKLHALRERAGAYLDVTEMDLEQALQLQAASEPE